MAAQAAEIHPASTEINLQSPTLAELETISFDYADTPLNHGWELIEGDIDKITFDRLSSNTIGNYLKISPSPICKDYLSQNHCI